MNQPNNDSALSADRILSEQRADKQSVLPAAYASAKLPLLKSDGNEGGSAGMLSALASCRQLIKVRTCLYLLSYSLVWYSDSHAFETRLARGASCAMMHSCSTASHARASIPSANLKQNTCCGFSCEEPLFRSSRTTMVVEDVAEQIACSQTQAQQV